VTAEVAEALAKVAGALPGGGEERPGQRAMAKAVARAVEGHRHLVVQAGTGTGKSLAYVVPVAVLGVKTVVATATKHLQDQLAGHDLPQVAAALGRARRLDFAVLKGRANYLCRQRARELAERGGAAPADERQVAEQVRRLLAWAHTTPTGERSELPFEPDPRAWAAVSVGARECPGAYRCPSGPDCFAELARARAAAADVVVVNTHLYAAHLAAGGAVLPEHEVVVFDEAHAVEDVMTEGLGLELTPGRLRAAAASTRGLLEEGDRPLAEALSETADRLDAALAPLAGRRVLRGEEGAGSGTAGRPPPTPGDGELRAVLELAQARLAALSGALRRAGAAGGGRDEAAHCGEPGGPADADAPRRTRALLSCSHLLDDLRALADLGPEQVAWVEAGGPGGRPRALRAAPVEVGPILAERLWPQVTAVLTSATVPPLARRRLGLPDDRSDELDVGSPFPYEANTLLYCAAHLPDRRLAEAEPALHDELAALVEAAGGRTLALFTSWRAMTSAVEAMRARLDYPVLAQGDLPKAVSLARFAGEEGACLFATLSFWQGVDVPGPTLSLVVLDRLPFPRPDDPLLEARRERAGAGAFRCVDLPRAATLLAQGAGRLVRSSADRGVVAVLDRRLVTAAYGAELRSALPPMPFTTDRAQALGLLSRIAAERRGACTTEMVGR
jgi:ATP-dependent DNA helicase DinG